MGVTALLFALLSRAASSWPSLAEVLLWVALLAAAELLAVSLSGSAEVSMAFPIHLALALVFLDQPVVAMGIAAAAAFDRHEIRRQMELHKALFNRATAALSVGAAVLPLSLMDSAAENPQILPVVLAAALHLIVNLGLVAGVIRLESGAMGREVLELLVPRPVMGFFVSYALLTGLGVATAIAYVRIPAGGWVVAAILIPLLFARVSIIAARNQQDLSKRLQQQQQALLSVTQDLFQEREKERQRIAADIHDSSLQSLAAAAYACGNAIDALNEGNATDASSMIGTARGAVTGAIDELRDSLADLRRSALKEGGLAATIEAFALQVRMLWRRNIELENRVTHEPPIPVALAAFQILQEGVTNALKHSEDGAIRVEIDDDEGVLRVIVQDQGPGFHRSEKDDEAHLGLRLMDERAKQIGGHLQVETSPGKGTRIVATLPGTSAL